jgi:hypothetical protein
MTSSSAAAPTGGSPASTGSGTPPPKGGRKKQLTIAIAAFAAIVLVAVTAFAWPGWWPDGKGSSDDSTPGQDESASVHVYDDWADITSVSDDGASQDDLKNRFLAGFIDPETGKPDEAKLDDAIEWLEVDASSVDGVDARWIAFGEFVKSDDVVIGVENVAKAQLDADGGHVGYVGIRPQKDSDSTMLAWRLTPKAAEGAGSCPVKYDDRGETVDVEVRFNVLYYGLDRKLSDDEVRQLLLDSVKCRPAALQAYYYSAFGELLDIDTLVVDPAAYRNQEPTYVSARGEAYWYDLKEALMSAESVERRELTAEERSTLFNTGSDGVVFNQSRNQGVGGDDILVIVWRLKSGRDVIALFRCGNTPVPGDVRIPSGPTDDNPNPEPEPKDPAKDVWVNPGQNPDVKDKTRHRVDDGDGSTPNPSPTDPPVPDSEIWVGTEYSSWRVVKEYGDGGYWEYSVRTVYNKYKDGHREAIRTESTPKVWHQTASPPPKDGNPGGELHGGDPGE